MTTPVRLSNCWTHCGGAQSLHRGAFHQVAEKKTSTSHAAWRTPWLTVTKRVSRSPWPQSDEQKPLLGRFIRSKVGLGIVVVGTIPPIHGWLFITLGVLREQNHKSIMPKTEYVDRVWQRLITIIPRWTSSFSSKLSASQGQLCSESIENRDHIPERHRLDPRGI